MSEWLTLGNIVIVINNKQKKQEDYIIKYKLRTENFFLNGSSLLALALIEKKLSFPNSNGI